MRNNATIEAIANLFGFLDEDRPNGIRLTTCAKDLHRKIPNLIPLYDPHIWNCYSNRAATPRVPKASKRSYREYALLWLPDVKADLVQYEDAWSDIAAWGTKPPITNLRALDIIGWLLRALITAPASLRGAASADRQVGGMRTVARDWIGGLLLTR
ncbi:hypothetical protein E4J89_14315 [Arthrobacter sp. CAU 1506]|uniref:DUF6308 family protein n=1 Tax=Arthrobacter sp. CAU 1506 TaxID=2560052 RepID=UPI0010ACAD2B|nr:DUF6308 family protein [Arthrobacter sp. CAU 1506]TJY67465.1 hypothetical protein E4J89_14315 [Arthrobacter sp. CAU 1506]